MNRIPKTVLRGRKFWRKPATLIMLVVVLLIPISALFRGLSVAYADEIHHVITHSATVITTSETVKDMVVIGNDVHVAGKVTDNLIVINGTAYLSPTAHVDSIVDIGGQVLRQSGAKVNNIYTLTFNHPLLNSTVLGGALIAFLAGLQLIFSAAVVLVPVVLSFLLRTGVQTTSSYLQNSIRRIGVIGLLATVSTIAAVGGLSVTVIGIPLAALIGLAYLLFGLVGLTHVTVFIGKSLLDALTKHKEPWLQSLIGATLVMAFANVPIIGALLFACVWIIGIGTVTTWLWRIRFDNKH